MKFAEVIRSQALSPLLELGYEILSISERKTNTSTFLEVTIDKSDGSSVNIGDCIKASKTIEKFFEPQWTRKDYTLQVTSPGLDKPLIEPKHFMRSVGKNVKISFEQEDNTKKKIKGELIKADDNEIVVKTEDGPIAIAYDKVHKANIDTTNK